MVSIGREYVFIDLGGKSEGYFPVAEVTGEDGQPTVAVGDMVSAYFLSAGKGGMLFTTRLGAGAEAQAHLQEAFANAIPVEGTIDKEIKGGYQVKIAGGVRAFCPFSQLGLRLREEEEVVGRSLSFLIIEYRDNGKSVVVSHRRLVEEERKARREELRATLEEGMTVRGVVTSVQRFGAFVDIGGLEGLVPISEIAWSRVENIEDVLHVGQELDLVILKLDWDNDRFSFSRKQALTDPWSQAAATFPVGSIHTGTVARLTNFGAFVTLADGIDGLVHISKLGAGRRINHPREVVQVGDSLEVKIEAVDQEARRLSLAVVTSDPAAAPVTDEPAAAGKSAPTPPPSGGSFGTLGDLLAAKLKGGKG